ncbi:hypothetical protein KUCAC02_009042 [Chaenocephalus aceratus]|uniref:Uncharacterized protein n=1 Tax=Chaenocephalus aceratus TaxID=36190 RepID=A0ACB9WSY6_CHAAC|nr:hypothetical protein KUCAC02_009042 [Chaenocephalus aceratus]
MAQAAKQLRKTKDLAEAAAQEQREKEEEKIKKRNRSRDRRRKVIYYSANRDSIITLDGLESNAVRESAKKVQGPSETSAESMV